MTGAVASELALILDYHFGERLIPLARSMPVYVVSSPRNASAVETAWNELSRKDGFLMSFGATGFQANQTTVEDVVAEQLDHIESVHGHEGGERPYARLHIYGLAPSPTLEGVLAEHGFLDVKATDYGLVAER